MPSTVTVLYPTGSDAKFDMDYYLSTHMPLVQSKWGSKGLKAWKVTKLAEASDTEKPYSVQAFLDFTNLGDFQRAVDEDGKEVLGDIPNFSNKEPIIMPGDITGTS